MTPSTPTWDITPPRRPSLDDLGGGQKINDPTPGFAPNPQTMVTGDDVNQWATQIQKLNAVVPHTIVSVHNAGSPVIFSVTSMIAAVSAVSGIPFTVVTHGNGDFSLTWPANTFPAQIADPEAIVTGGTSGFGVAQALTNEVRVRTSTLGGLANLNVNVRLF